MFRTYFDPGGVLVYTAITLAGVVVALVKGFAPVERWVDGWARAHGIQLTDRTRPFVAARLQAGRRIRTTGFVIGWCMPYALLWWTRDLRVFSGPVGQIALQGYVAGYVIATLAAELWLNRPTRAARAASLEPRTVAAYIPRWARLAPLLTVIGAFVLVILYVLLPWRDEGFGPSIPSYLRTAWVAVPVVVIGELLQRLVVLRRQPYDSADVIEADDALRSSSVSRLAGVSIAFVSFIWAGMAWSLGARTDVQVIRWVTPFLALAAIICGLAAFFTLASPGFAWRVRRRAPAEVA